MLETNRFESLLIHHPQEQVSSNNRPKPEAQFGNQFCHPCFLLGGVSFKGRLPATKQVAAAGREKEKGANAQPSRPAKKKMQTLSLGGQRKKKKKRTCSAAAAIGGRCFRGRQRLLPHGHLDGAVEVCLGLCGFLVLLLLEAPRLFLSFTRLGQGLHGMFDHVCKSCVHHVHVHVQTTKWPPEDQQTDTMRRAQRGFERRPDNCCGKKQ